METGHPSAEDSAKSGTYTSWVLHGIGSCFPRTNRGLCCAVRGSPRLSAAFPVGPDPEERLIWTHYRGQGMINILPQMSQQERLSLCEHGSPPGQPDCGSLKSCLCITFI
ncbi:uncharacterized protein LOC144223564 [Crocuta crocuta]